MATKIVSEREVPMLNPEKRFFPDFPICKDRGIAHTSYSYRKVADVGKEGVALVEAVLAVPGVYDLTISDNELRVAKYHSHSWEEITPQIREAFKKVFGDDIVFPDENRLVLMIRRTRVALQINKL